MIVLLAGGDNDAGARYPWCDSVRPEPVVEFRMAKIKNHTDCRKLKTKHVAYDVAEQLRSPVEMAAYLLTLG